MKWWLFLFVFCLFSVSCSNNKGKIKIPVDVICRDTMVDVLTDVHLAKAAQQMGMFLDSADTSHNAPFEYVWKKHRINDSLYQKSLDFYTHHPAILDSIYENVLNTLSKQKAELLAKRHLK